MVNDEKLHGLCRDLLIASSARIQKIISSGEKIPYEEENDLTERGGSIEVIRKKRQSVSKLIRDHQKEFYDSEEGIKFKSRLKEIRQELLKSTTKKDNEIYGMMTEITVLSPLFDGFFDNRQSYINFDNAHFEALYDEMENFVYGKLPFHYFAPLPKFSMKGRKLDLHNGLVIKRITHDELVEIAGVNLIPLVTAFGVTYPFDDLHYMLEYRSEWANDNGAFDLFLEVVHLLRVFQEGEVGISTVFKNILWRFAYERSVPNQWKIHFYHGRYVLDGKETAKFKQFYRSLRWILKNRKSAASLKIAISRFNSALEEANSEDQIIDFMIALEAMYSLDNKELSYRISYRIANLLAKEDYARKLMFLLLRQTYDRRSALVHGAEFKPIKIRRNLLGRKYGKQKDLVYDKDNVARELEKITRESIKKFLKLAMRYESREDILSDLDLCVLSDNYRMKLKQITDMEIRLYAASDQA